MVYWSVTVLSQEESVKKSRRQKLSELLYKPPRTQNAFNNLHREAGFINLFNIDDVEQRRVEIKSTLEEAKAGQYDPQTQKEVVQKTFKLFFSAGNPWYRGLDNRELAWKVSAFLQNYTEIGYIDEFIPDLFEESMQLLSLSWQALDVTNTPPYILETKTQRIENTGVMPRFQTGSDNPLGRRDNASDNQ
jgi:hypothetical protein